MDTSGGREPQSPPPVSARHRRSPTNGSTYRAVTSGALSANPEKAKEWPMNEPILIAIIPHNGWSQCGFRKERGQRSPRCDPCLSPASGRSVHLPLGLPRYLVSLISDRSRPSLPGRWIVTTTRRLQVNPSRHLHYQPVLYTLDLIVPIVNLNQGNLWSPAGSGQWIAATLIAFGWILATVVIAGITRVLTRG